MKILTLYKKLLNIAVSEFGTVIEAGEILYTQGNVPGKLRLYLCDCSYIDIYYSMKGKYSYHRNNRLVSNKIYRHDNAPHQKWKNISTFPKHFHNGSEDIVVQSNISENPEIALREFLVFVLKHIQTKQPNGKEGS
jgi:hypothetical protein